MKKKTRKNWKRKPLDIEGGQDGYIQPSKRKSNKKAIEIEKVEPIYLKEKSHSKTIISLLAILLSASALVYKCNKDNKPIEVVDTKPKYEWDGIDHTLEHELIRQGYNKDEYSRRVALIKAEQEKIKSVSDLKEMSKYYKAVSNIVYSEPKYLSDAELHEVIESTMPPYENKKLKPDPKASIKYALWYLTKHSTNMVLVSEGVWEKVYDEEIEAIQIKLYRGIE
jgi:hypothetical protein